MYATFGLVCAVCVCVIDLLWILTLGVFDAEYRPYQAIARFHIAPSSTVAAYANADVVAVTIRRRQLADGPYLYCHS